MSDRRTVMVGVDIGGTFTDSVAIDHEGRIHIGKARSTPPDFETGFMDSLASLASRTGDSLTGLLGRAEVIYHGCTVGTNALVEGRTARVGLVATAGHGDSTFFMQGGGRLLNMPAEYIAHVAAHDKPPPLVPRNLVGEIFERVTSDGSILVELNEASARGAIARLVDGGADAFAVALLWSVVNDAHEQRVAALIEEMAPASFVSLSSEIVPRVGEYQRTVATIINSLVGPVMTDYLGRLSGELAKGAYAGSLEIMSCSGGLISVEEAMAKPLLTIGSGPVAGVVGAHRLARSRVVTAVGTETRETNVLTVDMGGTTFDVAVIDNDAPLRRSNSWFGQFEYAVPSLDVASVGVGGGSLIRFDRVAGTLRVGPESAGARPGPAAYPDGGDEATICDADLVLGYLNPGYFLGGAIALDPGAARAALARAGEPMGLDAEEVAAAAVRIADSQMADAIRFASIGRGYDPRRFVIYAYGGAGPVHATALARQLGIEEVVIPMSDFASGWSAFGVAVSEALALEEMPLGMRQPFPVDVLRQKFDELGARARRRLVTHHGTAGEPVLERTASLKFAMQSSETNVDVPGGLLGDDVGDELVRRFRTEYERVYGQGTGYSAAGYLLTGIAVRARAEERARMPSPRPGPPGSPPRPKGRRDVIWYEDGPVPRPTPVFDGTELGPGARLEGPAIVELPDTTIVLRPAQSASVDAHSSVVITV